MTPIQCILQKCFLISGFTLTQPTDFTLWRHQLKQRVTNIKSPWAKTSKTSHVTFSFLMMVCVFTAVPQVTTAHKLEARLNGIVVFYEPSSPCAIFEKVEEICNKKLCMWHEQNICDMNAVGIFEGIQTTCRLAKHESCVSPFASESPVQWPVSSVQPGFRWIQANLCQ